MTDQILGVAMVLAVGLAFAGTWLFGLYDMHKSQVKLLQAQVREYRSAMRDRRMALTIEGLWPELDEKERLRARVRELEGKA